MSSDPTNTDAAETPAPVEAPAQSPVPAPNGSADASPAPESNEPESAAPSTAPAENDEARAVALPATEAEGSGEPSDAASADSETSSSEPGAPDASSAVESEGADAHASGDSGAPGEGKKKKRRRRRRKKKGAAAAEGSPPAEEAKSHPASKPPKKPKPATERAPFHVGEEVFGRVTAVIDSAIMVDLSGKALAIFDRSEMEADDLVPAPGDRFVARVHQDGGRGGLVVLTRQPLREEASKVFLEQAAKEGSLVRGLITGVIKGGVEVDIQGVRAFAPASGMDLHPHNANLAALLGSVLDFKVSQFEKQGRDVVVTRRPMLEAEAHERRKKALELLQEGQVVKGIVRTVVEWGAFVALPEAENLEGLVHVSEVAHDPRAKVADLLKPGEEVELKITRIDEKGKIWLSRKALISDPWADAKSAHPDGSRHKGKVTRVEKFGVFVELEPGIEGLVHVSDLSLNRVEHPEEIVKAGEEFEVVVHHFDLRNRKIVLHPAPSAEHADEKPQKVARNASVKAEVVRGESAGVVVRLLGVTGRAARGFIPAGHTGTLRGTDLRKKFKPGTVIDAKVLEVDPRRGEPRLSIRAHAEDEERRAHREYRQKLAKEGGFGTLGDLLSQKLK